MLNDETDCVEANRELLHHFSTNLIRHTLSHGLLFYGSSVARSHPFLLYLSAMLLCHDAKNRPCRRCQSCQLVLSNTHPDLTEIKPEKKTSLIKIESMRNLYELVYRSPQLGFHRVVLIKYAEKMNTSASHALLKLLEEPPKQVYFILQTSQLNSILPTVLSRCQIWRVEDDRTHYQAWSDWIKIASDDDPDLAKIIEDLPQFLVDFECVVKQKQVCTIASKWVAYDLAALVAILYWMNASLIKGLLGQPHSMLQCHELLPHVTLPLLFNQMDKLNHILRHLNQGIAMNALLTIEDFLLGYHSFNSKKMS